MNVIFFNHYYYDDFTLRCVSSIGPASSFARFAFNFKDISTDIAPEPENEAQRAEATPNTELPSRSEDDTACSASEPATAAADK